MASRIEDGFESWWSELSDINDGALGPSFEADMFEQFINFAPESGDGVADSVDDSSTNKEAVPNAEVPEPNDAIPEPIGLSNSHSTNNDAVPNEEAPESNNAIPDPVGMSNSHSHATDNVPNEGAHLSANVIPDSVGFSGDRGTVNNALPNEGPQESAHVMPGSFGSFGFNDANSDVLLGNKLVQYLTAVSQAEATASGAAIASNDFDRAFADMEAAGLLNLRLPVNRLAQTFTNAGECAAGLVSPVTANQPREQLNCSPQVINAGQQPTTEVTNLNSFPESDKAIPSAVQVPNDTGDQTVKTGEVAQQPTVQNTVVGSPAALPAALLGPAVSSSHWEFNQQTTNESPQSPFPEFDQQELAMDSQLPEDFEDEIVANQTNDDDEEMTLLFSSVEEANEWPKRPPMPYDPTLPRTVPEKKVWVKELMKAVRSFLEAEDNEHMVQPFRARKHSIIRVEIVSWNLLTACISRHTTGPLLMGFEVKHNKTTANVSTFKERIADMLHCLRTHKTICKHLLDPLYIYNFVDDPQGARQRVRSNKSLNKKKTEVMNAGKSVLGQRGTTPRSGGSKKRGNKNARASREELPTPLTTPSRSLDTAAPPATPERNPRAGPPSGYFSPEQQTTAANMTPGMSPAMASDYPGSVNTSATNSPANYNPNFLEAIGSTMGLPVTLPTNTQLGSTTGYSTPTITYPTGRTTHCYSPSKPSGLQKVYQSPHGFPEHHVQQQHAQQQHVQHVQQQLQHLQQPQQQFQNIMPQFYQPGLAHPPNIQLPPYPNMQQVTTHPQVSGLSATHTQFNRGAKRPRDDANGSDSSGSPRKKARG